MTNSTSSQYSNQTHSCTYSSSQVLFECDLCLEFLLRPFRSLGNLLSQNVLWIAVKWGSWAQKAPSGHSLHNSLCSRFHIHNSLCCNSIPIASTLNSQANLLVRLHLPVCNNYLELRLCLLLRLISFLQSSWQKQPRIQAQYLHLYLSLLALRCHHHDPAWSLRPLHLLLSPHHVHFHYPQLLFLPPAVSLHSNEVTTQRVWRKNVPLWRQEPKSGWRKVGWYRFDPVSFWWFLTKERRFSEQVKFK